MVHIQAVVCPRLHEEEINMRVVAAAEERKNDRKARKNAKVCSVGAFAGRYKYTGGGALRGIRCTRTHARAALSDNIWKLRQKGG